MEVILHLQPCWCRCLTQQFSTWIQHALVGREGAQRQPGTGSSPPRWFLAQYSRDPTAALPWVPSFSAPRTGWRKMGRRCCGAISARGRVGGPDGGVCPVHPVQRCLWPWFSSRNKYLDWKAFKVSEVLVLVRITFSFLPGKHKEKILLVLLSLPRYQKSRNFNKLFCSGHETDVRVQTVVVRQVYLPQQLWNRGTAVPSGPAVPRHL